MTDITRDNVEHLLDTHRIKVAMSNGNWWLIRRNGKTKRWRRDPNRLRIPYKMGLRGYGAITETDFIDGTLNSDVYRAED